MFEFTHCCFTTTEKCNEHFDHREAATLHSGLESSAQALSSVFHLSASFLFKRVCSSQHVVQFEFQCSRIYLIF